MSIDFIWVYTVVNSTNVISFARFIVSYEVSILHCHVMTSVF